MTDFTNFINKSMSEFTLDYLCSRRVQNRMEALNMADAMGYAVIPVNPKAGKKTPLIAGGYKAATRDVSVVRDWWDTTYKGAMVGVATGTVNGIIVVDVDMKKDRDGLKSLETLEAKAGETLPRDYAVRTPTGGYHFYFKLQEGQEFKCSAGTLAEGIDIRADGGYVVSQGSVNDADESYEIISTKHLPDLPDWFAALLIDAENDPADKLLAVNGAFPEGQRNSGLFRLCAVMRSKGLEGDKLTAFALWANDNLCAPPLPIDEVVHIVSNLDSYSASYSFDIIGYSERFADRFVHELKCLDGECWYRWNGVVWERSKVAANESAKVLAKELEAIAKAMPEPITKEAEKNSVRDALLSHSAKMRNNPLSVVRIAATDAKLARRLHDFDNHPLLLNTPNCIVDLNTGEMLPHTASYLMTKQTTAHYNPDSYSSEWQNFLTFFTDGNQEIEAYLARLFGGIGLIDGNPDQVFVMLSGPAKNGKSTFIDNVMHAVGDYTDILRAEVLVGDASRDFRHDLADMQGARMVNTNEPPQNCKLNCSFLKAYTGGDTLKGRHNYAESVTFKGSGLIVLATNWEPELPHGDIAMHRRIQMYRHEAAVPDDKRDAGLKERLKQPQHAEAILAWLVRGRLDYLRQGLNCPALIQAQIKDYIGTKDILSAFLVDSCLLGEGLKIQAQDLYQAFMRYRAGDYADPISQRKFGELVKRHFSHSKSNWKVFYHGLKLHAGN